MKGKRQEVLTNQLFILILGFILVGSLFFNFQGAKAQVDPLVIFDDWFGSTWTNSWNWGISNDLDTYVEGSTSMKIAIDPHSQFEGIDKPLGYNLDLTVYDDLYFWFKGNSSNLQLQIRFYNNATSFYYHAFNDDFYGWGYVPFLDFKGAFAFGGTPDWSLIEQVSFTMSSDNAINCEYWFDYLFFTNNDDVLPTPSPPPDPDLVLTIQELLFGSLAWIGILLFIILGLVAIKLSKYSGAFVFLIAMLYELMLYDQLDIYGNNIWYMVIVLIYAIFCALSIFWKD